MRAGAVVGISVAGVLGAAVVALAVAGGISYATAEPSPGDAFDVDQSAIVCAAHADRVLVTIPLAPSREHAWVQRIETREGEGSVTGFGIGDDARPDVRQGFSLDEPGIVSVWVDGVNRSELTTIRVIWSPGEPLLEQDIRVSAACG